MAIGMQEYKAKEDLEQAKKFAECVVIDMFESELIDDDRFKAALEYAKTKFADAVYARDESIRNSCREVLSASVAEAVKRAVL